MQDRVEEVGKGWLERKGEALAGTRLGGVVEERVAREAHGEERDRLYRRAKSRYATYAAYEKRSSRRMPVMVLSRP